MLKVYSGVTFLPMNSTPILLFTLLALSGQTAFAADRTPAFNSEMTVSDVLKVAGPAKERIERESKRETLWNFEGYWVVFHEERIKEWSGVSLEPRGIKTETEITRAPRPGKLIAASQPPADTKDLLSEILKEVPSTADSPNTGGNNPNITPPVVEADE